MVKTPQDFASKACFVAFVAVTFTPAVLQLRADAPPSCSESRLIRTDGELKVWRVFRTVNSEGTAINHPRKERFILFEDTKGVVEEYPLVPAACHCQAGTTPKPTLWRIFETNYDGSTIDLVKSRKTKTRRNDPDGGWVDIYEEIDFWAPYFENTMEVRPYECR